MSWKCDSCNLVLKSTSKYAHLKSKRHQSRITSQPDKDCLICLETTNTFQHCEKCLQYWCGNCDQNIFKCPFCRIVIPGRQEQATEQEQQLVNWYASSEAFIPDRTPNQTQRYTRHYLTFLQDLEEMDELIAQVFARRTVS